MKNTINDKTREITLDERKQIQLEMLQEVHDFCVANGIRYSLAFGTLLGAIRHKGYIPWDDDVDIIMPLPDMLRFKQTFKSEKVKYCDVDTEPHYSLTFSRIAYIPTYTIIGLKCKSYGVSIDLYPVISLPETEDEQFVFFEKARRLQQIRTQYMVWRDRIISRLPLSSIPGFDRSIKNCCKHFYNNSPMYGSTGIYYIIAIPISRRNKVTYRIDLFEKTVLLPFENRNFLATGYYEEFLTHMYGDYMQLPPEEDRQPYHGGKFYWK